METDLEGVLEGMEGYRRGLDYRARMKGRRSQKENLAFILKWEKGPLVRVFPGRD